MAKTFKRNINIIYKEEGLQEIKKKMEGIEPSIKDTGIFKEYKRGVNELETIMKSIDLSGVDATTADHVDKHFKQVIRLSENAKVEALKTIDEETGASIEGLEAQLRALEDFIEKKKKLSLDVKADYVESKYGYMSSPVATIRKGSGDQAAENILTSRAEEGKEDQMVGYRGRDLKLGSSFLENAKKIRATLSSLDGISKEINTKIRTGKELTEAEIIELQKTIDLNKEKDGALKNFKITAQEIANQNELSFQVEREQQRLLFAERDKYLTAAEDGIDEAKTKVSGILSLVEKIQKEEIGGGDLSESQRELLDNVEELTKAQFRLKTENENKNKSWKKAEREAQRETKKTTKVIKEQDTTIGKAVKQVFNYSVAIRGLRKVYRETINTITQLDAALTEMSVVTSMSREESWKLVGTFQELAKETGFTTTEIAKLSTVYFRQGKALKDVIELTTVAAKAARVAGISAEDSANYLTAAVNGFGLAANKALDVSDKFAALAASSASSYEELATGLSKFAAQANIAGISIDFALGMLAKGVETTREAPETIGTALKTVISRMRELTDLGKTMEDGMDVNRVDRALGQVGISLMGANGQFRDMEEILTDVGKAWGAFNTNQQASVAVALAGTRQQSRLIAIMNDFDRTLELVETSQESAGATAAQHLEYMNSMEASMTHLQTAWQQFITAITDSEVIISIVRAIGDSVEFLADGIERLGVTGHTAMVAMASLAAVVLSYSTYQKILNNETGIYSAIRGALNIVRTEDLVKMTEENATTLRRIGLTKAEIAQLYEKDRIMTHSINTNMKKALTDKNLTDEQRKKILLDTLEVKTIREKSRGLIVETGLKIKAAVATQLYAMGIISKSAAEAAGVAVTTTATVAQHGFNAAMAANPIGFVATAVIALVVALGVFVKGTRDAENGTNSLSSSIVTSMAPIIGMFKMIWGILVDVTKLLLGLIAPAAKLSMIFSGAFFLVKAIEQVADAIGVILALIESVVAVIEFLIYSVAEGLKYIGDQLSKIPLVGWLVSAGKEVVKFGNTAMGLLKRGTKGIRDFSAATRKETDLMKKSYEELEENIGKVVEQNQADIYELSKKNKEIEKLSKEYGELNSKSIKTDDDIEALDELRNNLRDLNKEFIGADGKVKIGLVDEELDKNKKEISKNLIENANEILQLARKDMDKFLESEENVDILSAVFFDSDGAQRADMTEEQRKGVTMFYEKMLKENEKAISKASSQKKKSELMETFRREALDFTEIIQTLGTDLETIDGGDSSENILGRRIDAYKEQLARLDGPEAEALRAMFPELEFMIDRFGEKLESSKYIKMFDQLGLDSETFNAIEESLKGSGRGIEEFMEGVASEQEKLEEEGVSSSMAFSQAWANAVSSTDWEGEGGSENRNQLAMVVFGKATRDTANEIDTLSSKIKNINETQDKFLSGELSDTELAEFLDDYGDVLEGDTLEAFLSGGDATGRFRSEMRQTMREYEKGLQSINAELKRGDLTQVERDRLLIEKRKLELMINYRDELANVTRSQHKYNSTLERYNRLQKLGIENTELENELMVSQVAFGAENIDKGLEEIAKIKDQLKEDLGEDYESYYNILDGVIIWNFDKLKEDGKRADKELRENYQSQLDLNLDFYKELMDNSVKKEKRLADEKVKVYEDYFAALDRLENKRERQQTREDLTRQIQRLEGASDSKSREKAKELRQELNELDTSSQKESQEESRKALIESINDSVTELEDSWKNIFEELVGKGAESGAEFVRMLEGAGLVESGTHSKITSSASSDERVSSYRSGGIVDYTGVANVHGTSTRPEAFLSAQQTQLFANLRDTLQQSSSTKSNAPGAFTIENITIQTESLNRNQDFKKAGGTLADAFSKAISRRGLPVNTKR